MPNQFCAAIRAAVAAGDTTINLGAQGAITALAAGASYPFDVCATRMDGSGKEYLSATADNSSGVLTVARGVYGTAALTFKVGDGLIKESPNTQGQFSNLVSGNSASPTGNVSTTEKAMGLGATAGFFITPKSTGRIAIVISGMVLNSTLAGDGTNVTGRYGTGAAPANGATSGLGTQFGLTQHFIAATTAEQSGFTVMGNVTGLALGTKVWLDLSLLAVTGGGSSVKDVQCMAWEY